MLRSVPPLVPTETVSAMLAPIYRAMKPVLEPSGRSVTVSRAVIRYLSP